MTSAPETWTHLCNLISGVPFHSQEDLGKDLWHIEAVVSEKEDICFTLSDSDMSTTWRRNDVWVCIPYPSKSPYDGIQAHLCLHRKSFSCSVISDSGSLLQTWRSCSLSTSVRGLSRASLLLCDTILKRVSHVTSVQIRWDQHSKRNSVSLRIWCGKQ